VVEVKFIGQSVKYVGGYGGAQTVESAAKTCTQTSPSKDPGKFVDKLIKRGHMSPVEFGFADFLIECDRAIQQELTRHRHFSFNVESTRWISYLKKPLRFVTKPPEGWDVPEEAVELLEEFCELSALVYEALLDMGAPRDYARKAFTLALASKIRMAGNFRAWREMLGKRLGKTAHPEAMEIAERALSELRDRVLGVFDGIGEA
jgi:thymidylate synthase (FAD)